MDPAKPLRRARSPRTLGGVCAGFAQWLGWDVTLVRVLYILATIFTGLVPCTVAYLVLWIVMPEET